MASAAGDSNPTGDTSAAPAENQSDAHASQADRRITEAEAKQAKLAQMLAGFTPEEQAALLKINETGTNEEKQLLLRLFRERQQAQKVVEEDDARKRGQFIRSLVGFLSEAGISPGDDIDADAIVQQAEQYLQSVDASNGNPRHAISSYLEHLDKIIRTRKARESAGRTAPQQPQQQQQQRAKRVRRDYDDEEDYTDSPPARGRGAGTNRDDPAVNNFLERLLGFTEQTEQGLPAPQQSLRANRARGAVSYTSIIQPSESQHRIDLNTPGNFAPAPVPVNASAATPADAERAHKNIMAFMIDPTTARKRPETNWENFNRPQKESVVQAPADSFTLNDLVSYARSRAAY